MRILVTGGSGFLGTHICSYFGADDFSRRAGFDLLNLQDVYKAEEYDVIIHLGALLEKAPAHIEDVFLTNVEGTVNLLRVLKPNTTFIFASTKDVYGRFADNYKDVPESCETIYSGQSALEWSKLIAEKYVRFYAETRGFRTCIFRLSNLYAKSSEGNRSNFVAHYANLVKSETTLRLPDNGKPIRDFLHVDDFSRACEAFADSAIRHGLYNLGGGRKNASTIRELVETMADCAGTKAQIDEENPLPNPVPYNYVSDISLVTMELDWSPQINLRDGISALFE
ncbi:MAG: NAD-dependent epimerase/dehydratase family protein [Pyrinomonadaceae bacterium]